MRSGWLLRDGDVVCALEMTDGGQDRRQGLRGRGSGDAVGTAGALHLDGARSVLGVGLLGPIDVAFLSQDLIVLRVTRVAPWRMALGGRGVCSALGAEAGALERWGVQVGDQLVIREVP
ncbi:MAG TPA: DUF192 domain-containing protein [Acidimicrobiales bacterium]|jgi:hypothetical protein